MADAHQALSPMATVANVLLATDEHSVDTPSQLFSNVGSTTMSWLSRTWRGAPGIGHGVPPACTQCHISTMLAMDKADRRQTRFDKMSEGCVLTEGEKDEEGSG